MITEDRILKMVRDGIDNEGSQKAYARRVGISESYLSDVLNRRRDISPKILEYFGLERVITYKPKDKK